MTNFSVAPSTNLGSAATRQPPAFSVAPSINEIDRRRAALGLSHSELCRLTRLDHNTWWSLRRGLSQPHKGTIKRLTEALDGRRPPEPMGPAMVKTLYRLAVFSLAKERGENARAVLVIATDFTSEKPRDPAWLAAATIRRLAMYLVTVEFEVTNADLARAIGCSRQNVHQARKSVEDMREQDAGLEAVLVEVAQSVRPIGGR